MPAQFFVAPLQTARKSFPSEVWSVPVAGRSPRDRARDLSCCFVAPTAGFITPTTQGSPVREARRYETSAHKIAAQTNHEMYQGD